MAAAVSALPSSIGIPQPDADAILQTLSVLFNPDDVIELRALSTRGRKRTDSGYFDGEHRSRLVTEAVRLNRLGIACYVPMNQIDPRLLGRYANRIEPNATATTTDADVLRRRWFLIDFDPARPKDTSATDAQLEVAKVKAREVYAYLKDLGWPEPVSALSGNGMHLLYPLDLPNDDASRELVKAGLKALAAQFDDSAIKLDQSVFNASRVTKLYGSVSCKGDHTPLAPHRLSRILKAPERKVIVTAEQLRALAPATPTLRTQRAPGTTGAYPAFDLDGFLSRLGIGYKQDVHEGSDRYRLETCPFNPEHVNGEAAIFRNSQGALGFKCQHSSCSDKSWQSVRELIDGPKNDRAGRPTANAKKEAGRAAPDRSEKKQEAKPKGGSDVEFVDPDPWHERVDGAALLTEMAGLFRRFIVLPEGAELILPLWVLHTWCIDDADIAPILAITSPEKRCGKTSLIGLLRKIVRRPLAASNITSAAVYRVVDSYHPSLLIDEADTFLRSSDELRGIINSGHTRPTASVVRLVGDNHEPRVFSTWSPKAIALIGALPGTIADRSIVVAMRRKHKNEKAERLSYKAEFHDIKSKCARWAQDNGAALAQSDPQVPENLNDRQADNWRELLTMATIAGGGWFERASKYASTLTDDDDDGEHAGVQLLADLRSMFDRLEVDRMFSNDICHELAQLVDRPWAQFGRSEKPISQRQLAKLLAPFDVRPITIRASDDRLKGYLLDAFNDAFTRYLPIRSVTPCQMNENNGLGAKRSVTTPIHVTDRNEPKSMNNQECHGVTDENTLKGEKEQTEEEIAAAAERYRQESDGDLTDDWTTNHELWKKDRAEYERREKAKYDRARSSRSEKMKPLPEPGKVEWVDF
ncbi:MAG: DUF3631 domain-containing protein [Pseudomonadota bacterium]|nr:DUF3631 domain-containing protein [Pseudomonadota bacterium]